MFSRHIPEVGNTFYYSARHWKNTPGSHSLVWLDESIAILRKVIFTSSVVIRWWVAIFWRQVGEWRQTGTSERELDKSRWRPTLKQERDVINKTLSENSFDFSTISTRRRFDFERTRLSRYRWDENVFICVYNFSSGAVAEETAVYESSHITLQPGHFRS